jgi:hypothetical protein
MFSLCSANAQVVDKFLDKRKDAAKGAVLNRTGKEADKGIRKGVNKGLDKIFGNEEADTTSLQSSQSDSSSEPSASSSSRSSGSGPGMNAIMKGMGISTGVANVKASYDFEGYIDMSVTDYKNESVEESLIYTTYLDSETPDYALEYSDENGDFTLIIFDSENQLLLTLGNSDGEKTGFAINYALEQSDSILMEDMEEEDAYAAYKTGKTKKILGYKCEEYRIENETDDGVVTMWVTEELNKEMKKAFMQNSTYTGLFMYAYNTKGVVMEYIIEDTSRNEKTEMTVTDIDLNKNNSISTKGYNIMSMDVQIPEDTE